MTLIDRQSIVTTDADTQSALLKVESTLVDPTGIMILGATTTTHLLTK
jgi:hypothetical protein